MFYPPYTPAVGIVRKHGSSTLTLALAILLSVGCLLSIVNIFVFPASFQNQFDQIGNMFGYDNLYSQTGAVVLTSVGLIFNVVGMIPLVLVAVGVWIFYLSCKNPTTPFVSGVGLTIIKVVLIVNTVLATVSSAFFMVVLAIGGSMLNEVQGDAAVYLPSSLIQGVMIITYIFIVIAIAFSILYLVFKVKTINAIRSTATSGIENINVSMFVIVMYFITGAFSFFGAFTNGISVGAIGSLVSCAVSFILGILLINYRKEITDYAMARATALNNLPNANYAVQPVLCPNCGNNYDPMADACPYCGTVNSLKQRM